MRTAPVTIDKKPLSELSDEIANLREQCGWSFRQIARHYGRSDGEISLHCLMKGIEGPRPRSTSNIGPERIQTRSGRVIRRFTAEEDRRLLELEATGMALFSIGRLLDRAPRTVRVRLATLARREERAMEPKR